LLAFISTKPLGDSIPIDAVPVPRCRQPTTVTSLVAARGGSLRLAVPAGV
jgi:hypothetical protein